MNSEKKHGIRWLMYIVLSWLLMFVTLAIGYYLQKHPGSFFMFNCKYTSIPPVVVLGFCAVVYTLKKALNNIEKKHFIVRFCIILSGSIVLFAVACQILLLILNLILLLP